jgi:D-3-phosphoglycerate dehydrogenase / 2-oxoglutarate reductase
MKILFIDTCHPFLFNSLKSDGYDCVEGYKLSYDDTVSVIHDFDGLVIRSRIQVDKNLLMKAVKLKFIARAGAGMESIDVDFALSRNITCINSPEGNRDAVGEHATGMLLSLMNNLNRADRQIRNGEWMREANRGHELQGKTVGIIGYGNMGSSFAEKLQGFGCKILAHDKYKKGFGNEYVRESSLQEIFDHADVLSIHVPLTPETEFFVDDDFINKFRKDIFLINTARGKCVKTDDLVKNMKSGKIAGACLDVIEYEDLSFEKFSGQSDFINQTSWQYLINSDNVMLSPHIAGWTVESLEKIARVLHEKICLFIKEKV